MNENDGKIALGIGVIGDTVTLKTEVLLNISALDQTAVGKPLLMTRQILRHMRGQ